MKVQKRNQEYEPVSFDKITNRIRNLCSGISPIVDPTKVALSTIKNLYDGIRTEELDNISAKIAESLKVQHPDYSILAARILISNLHKTTPDKFSECIRIQNEKLNNISDTCYKFIMDHADELDQMIINKNDYDFDYFGYKTMERSYLAKIPEIAKYSNGETVYVNRKDVVVPQGEISYARNSKPVLRNNRGTISEVLKPMKIDRVIDRPQYMLMQEAIQINYK